MHTPEKCPILVIFDHKSNHIEVHTRKYMLSRLFYYLAVQYPIHLLEIPLLGYRNMKCFYASVKTITSIKSKNIYHHIRESENNEEHLIFNPFPGLQRI